MSGLTRCDESEATGLEVMELVNWILQTECGDFREWLSEDTGPSADTHPAEWHERLRRWRETDNHEDFLWLAERSEGHVYSVAYRLSCKLENSMKWPAPENIPNAIMIELLRRIQHILWENERGAPDPHTEFKNDTIERVAEVLVKAGLRPRSSASS